ncbi:MAG: hypothetical protein KAH21_02295, partial [Spirochaetaceae bacterium]|nr:hypothetical protein [Spirochaetaceae bacterium]
HFDFNRTSNGSSTLYFMDLEFYGGIRLMFRSLRTDMSFGLSGALQYTPDWDGTSNYLSMYLPIDFRILYYFTDTLDKRPVYFITNISFSFFGYSFDLSGRNQNGRIDLSALISFGVGMRL